MGGSRKTLVYYLSANDIIETHRLHIIEHSGEISYIKKSWLIHPGSLYYLVESIRDSFLEEKYPTIIDKAAFLAWRIIHGHFFYDGNKRTAMSCCESFLEINGYKMKIDHDVERTALKVAAHEMEYRQFLEWLKTIIKKF